MRFVGFSFCLFVCLFVFWSVCPSVGASKEKASTFKMKVIQYFYSKSLISDYKHKNMSISKMRSFSSGPAWSSPLDISFSGPLRLKYSIA